MCPRTLFVSTFDTRGPVDCHLCVDCDDQTAPALWRLLRRRRVSSRQKHVQAKNQAPRNSRHTCFPLRGVRMQFKGFKCKTDFPTLMWCDVMWCDPISPDHQASIRCSSLQSFSLTPTPTFWSHRLFRVVQALPISCILLAAEIGRFFTEDLKLPLHYHQSVNEARKQSYKRASNLSIIFFVLWKKIGQNLHSWMIKCMMFEWQNWRKVPVLVEKEACLTKEAMFFFTKRFSKLHVRLQ